VVIYQVLVAHKWGYVPRSTGDVSYYANVAYSVLHGMWPYRDFPFEYPPLSILSFLGSPVTGSLEHYQHWFTSEMIVVDALAAVVTTAAAARIWRGLGRPLAAAVALAAAVVAAGAIATNRFDGVVALLLALALLCIVHRRLTLAAVVLGLGFAFKLTPVVVIPLVLVLAQTRRKAIVAALAALAAAFLPFVPFLVLDAHALVTSFVGGQVARGLQIESVAAAPYLLAQIIHPGTITVISPPGGSLIVSGAGTSVLSSLAPIMVLVLLVVLYLGVWRSRDALRANAEGIPVTMLAAVLATMVGNKVLSPQHLLWLLPFAALCLVGRRPLARIAGALMLVALVLTQVEYPGMYYRQIDMDPVPFAVIAARNGVLLAAFILAVVDVWRMRSYAPADPPAAVAEPASPPPADADPDASSPAGVDMAAEGGLREGDEPPADGGRVAGGTLASARRLRMSTAAIWAAAAFVAGRAITLAAGLASWAGQTYPPFTGRWLTSDTSILVRGSLGRLFDPWVAWDGIWYTSIARLGYRGPESPAFFPAYPYVVRAVSSVAGSEVIAGVCVSLVCAALAMIVLYRMVASRFGASTAAWTVAFLSLCPTSLFFGTVYSESLLLLLVVGSLALAERGLWLGACVVGALAALTRNTGVLLCLPLFLLYAERRGWTWRSARVAWPEDLRLAWLALVPGGLALYMAFLWTRFGDALAFITVQRAWARSFALPPVTVWRGAVQAWHALKVTGERWPLAWSWLGPAGDGQWMSAMVLLPFVSLVAAVAVMVAAWRRLPAAYNAWALVVVLVPLFSPARDQALLSYPRFLLLAFPLFIGVAVLTVRLPMLRWALLAVSAILLVWLSASFALFSWVA
jgi:Gpi18-like mannosyltransferase